MTRHFLPTHLVDAVICSWPFRFDLERLRDASRKLQMDIVECVIDRGSEVPSSVQNGGAEIRSLAQLAASEEERRVWWATVTWTNQRPCSQSSAQRAEPHLYQP